MEDSSKGYVEEVKMEERRKSGTGKVRRRGRDWNGIGLRTRKKKTPNRTQQTTTNNKKKG